MVQSTKYNNDTKFCKNFFLENIQDNSSSYYFVSNYFLNSFVIKKFWKNSFIKSFLNTHLGSYSQHYMNQPNKLECYKTLGWKGLPMTNTLT